MDSVKISMEKKSPNIQFNIQISIFRGATGLFDNWKQVVIRPVVRRPVVRRPVVRRPVVFLSN